MKQKVFFLLTLLIWGGISVSARNINADLSKGEVKGDGATWTAGSDGSYTLTWTAADQYVSLFKAFGGKEGGELDWSDGTQLCFQPANTSALEATKKGYNVVIVTANGTFSRWISHWTTKKELTLTATSGDGFKKDGWNYITAADLKHVTDVKLAGDATETELSVDISDMYVTISPKATLTFGADGKATIDLSKAEAYGGATYDYATQTVTSNGTAGYIEVVFDKAYDFTGILQGTVTHEGNLVQSFGFSNDHAFWGSPYAPNIQNAISQGYDYTAITSFKLNLNGTEGTMTLTDISFTANPMTVTDAHSTPIESLTNYAVDTNGNITESGKLASNYNTATDIFLGDWSGAPDNFINIEVYDELRVYTNKDNKFRAFMFKKAPQPGMDQDGYVATFSPDLYPNIITYNETAGYYAAKINDIKTLYNGQAKIIGMKSAYGATAVVSKITLYNEETTSEYDYTVSGQYSDAVSLDEIANSDACTIDCTGLTGADVKIGSKNPNCIVAVKKEGVVSATKNLAVNGNIANLELSDGHSVKIPAGMTATTAKYTRTMTNTYGTIVLPFDAVSDDNVEFYTISAMDANSITIEKVTTLAAGTPAIIKKLVSNDITINGDGSTLNGAVNNTTDAVNMFGSYTQDEKIADENAYYILDNKFWQCNEYFYCDAFRAYFTKPAGAPAANCLSLKENFGNPTLVDIVTGNAANGIQGVYNTAGVKMQGLQKGINIVRLASGETKTVIIK